MSQWFYYDFTYGETEAQVVFFPEGRSPTNQGRVFRNHYRLRDPVCQLGVVLDKSSNLSKYQFSYLSEFKESAWRETFVPRELPRTESDFYPPGQESSRPLAA